jgi:hypothetical protein
MSPSAWLIWALVISTVSFASGYELARYFERDRTDRCAVALQRTREALTRTRAQAETAHQWFWWLFGERAMVATELDALRAELRRLRAHTGGPGCRMNPRLRPTSRPTSHVEPPEI